MNYKECKEQLEGLIEHFNNGGRDFNATDIIAIKKMLSKIQKQKEVIDKAIEILGKYTHFTTPSEEQNSYNEDLVDKVYNMLKEVHK